MDSYRVPNQFIQPVGTWVYTWRRGDQWLYVGISSDPLSRVAHHNIIGKAERVREDDEVSVVAVFGGWYEAQAEENRLRAEHRPKYSPPVERRTKGKSRCIACRKTFDQSRWWQVFCSKPCQQGQRKRQQPKIERAKIIAEYLATQGPRAMKKTKEQVSG